MEALSSVPLPSQTLFVRLRQPDEYRASDKFLTVPSARHSRDFTYGSFAMPLSLRALSSQTSTAYLTGLTVPSESTGMARDSKDNVPGIFEGTVRLVRHIVLVWLP